MKKPTTTLALEHQPYACFDKITLYSKSPPWLLRWRLPTQELRELSHSFGIAEADQPSYGCPSIIFLTAPSIPFLELLQEHEENVGFYTFFAVELALEFPADDERGTYRLYDRIVPLARKKWAARKEIVAGKGDVPPPEGVFAGRQTVYWEGRGARLQLKGYCRRSKVTERSVFRVEWTAQHASSVREKMNIQRIGDLIDYDPEPFLSRYLSFERRDLATIGAWLTSRRRNRRYAKAQDRFSTLLRRRGIEAAEYWNRRTGAALLRGHAAIRAKTLDDYTRLIADHKTSTGLRRLLAELRHEGEASGGTRYTKYAGLSRYRIGTFFKRVEVRRPIVMLYPCKNTPITP